MVKVGLDCSRATEVVIACADTRLVTCHVVPVSERSGSATFLSRKVTVAASVRNVRSSPARDQVGLASKNFDTHASESPTGGGQAIQVAIGVGHEFIGFFGGGIQTDGVVHAVVL